MNQANQTPKAGVVKYAVYLGDKTDLNGVTPGKKYEVQRSDSHLFEIFNDKGTLLICRPVNCAFLKGDEWAFTYSTLDN